MRDYTRFYIDGEWCKPAGSATLDVINPATEEPAGKVSTGGAEDVDRAVKAARRAFESFGESSLVERTDLLKSILSVYERRYDDMADAITEEMGAPISLSKKAHAAMGIRHVQGMLDLIQSYPFERKEGDFTILREPIGVCGLITPWNWPINQIAAKVAPALAAGCTMVMKPSEIAPFSGHVFAEILDEAGVPAGVFNLVDGDGPTVGRALSSHPDIDMVSFTGSTRAGVDVAKNAADTVKRVTQELGGKSPNVLFEDADLEKAVGFGAYGCFMNTGQTCSAPTRMIVPVALKDRIIDLAREAAKAWTVGDPRSEDTKVGPLASEAQFNKVQGLIEKGISEGATLVTGGPGRPDGLNRGFYVRPTIFADVSNDMTIAREEIFGPVLSILTFASEDEAVAIANDTPYGLAAHVWSADHERARRVARRIKAGNVHINGTFAKGDMPFGGYKQSGNGREGGVFGLEEYLEIKAVPGY